MRSRMQLARGGGFELTLCVPADLAPVTLAFQVALTDSARPGTARYIAAHHAANFAVPVGMCSGSPLPMGALLEPCHCA